MITLSATKIITVDSDVYHDIELIDSSRNIIFTWWASNSAALSAGGYTPTTSYPFTQQTTGFDATSPIQGTAPFLYVDFNVVYDVEISRYTFAVNDKTVIDPTTFVVESSAGANYILSHPGEYTITVNVTGIDSSTESYTFTDHFVVDEIAPSPALFYSTSSINSLSGQFTPMPALSAMSWFDTSLSLDSRRSGGKVFFTTLQTKPGSFPLQKLIIDFGDSTGTTVVTKYGIQKVSELTKVYESSLIDLAQPNTIYVDPRTYIFEHQYENNTLSHTAYLTAISVDTGTSQISSVTYTYIGVGS